MAELRGPDSTDELDGALQAPPEPAPSYSEYLELPALLGLQRPRAEPPVHDEMLFIIVHQTHELWFKQILCELSVLVDDIDGARFDAAYRTLERIGKIARLLGEHLDVLETMPAAEFQRFRCALGTASGLESDQFRRLEQLAGVLPRVARVRGARADAASVSVRDAFLRGLAARAPGLGVDARAAREPEALGAALAELLAEPAFAPQRSLAEALLAFDEQVVVWRRQHFEMARAMIGDAAGTGGSSGAAYLRATMERRFFPELWHWRNARQTPPAT